MGTFPYPFDYRRLDTIAIVSNGGFMVIKEDQIYPCHEWLNDNDYIIQAVNCSLGIKQFRRDIGGILKWKENFGYNLEDGTGVIAALEDGFKFDVPEQGGLVLELLYPDNIWSEDPEWTQALLSIAYNHTRQQLACGKRFFTILILPEESPLIGKTINTIDVYYDEWPRI